MKITDDAGKELPWDGRPWPAEGLGPAVAKAYFAAMPISSMRRLFRHGDVATIDPTRLQRITDVQDVSRRAANGFRRRSGKLAVGHHRGAEAAVHRESIIPNGTSGRLLIVQSRLARRRARGIMNTWMQDRGNGDAGRCRLRRIPHTDTGKI